MGQQFGDETVGTNFVGEEGKFDQETFVDEGPGLKNYREVSSEIASGDVPDIEQYYPSESFRGSLEVQDC